jgi:hypothetical protein
MKKLTNNSNLLATHLEDLRTGSLVAEALNSMDYEFVAPPNDGMKPPYLCTWPPAEMATAAEAERVHNLVHRDRWKGNGIATGEIGPGRGDQRNVVQGLWSRH